jgi:hypothetical protein
MDSTPPVQMIFAWVGRNQRLAKDFEATMESAGAFLYAASVMLLVRRIDCPRFCLIRSHFRPTCAFKG